MKFEDIKIGDNILIRAVVSDLFPKGTLGFSRGWFDVEIPGDGLIGNKKFTLDFTSIHSKLEKTE